MRSSTTSMHNSKLPASAKARRRKRYENGRIVERPYYSTTNGRDSVLNFVYTSDGRTKIRKNISEGSINVEEYDDSGNLTEDAYYDLAMNPIEKNGYSKRNNSTW